MPAEGLPPLLALPLEVRQRIYTLVEGPKPNCPVHGARFEARSPTTADNDDAGRNRFGFPLRPCLHNSSLFLLQICKQIHTEYQPMVFQRASLLSGGMEVVLGAPLSKLYPLMLGHVREVHTDTSDYTTKWTLTAVVPRIFFDRLHCLILQEKTFDHDIQAMMEQVPRLRLVVVRRGSLQDDWILKKDLRQRWLSDPVSAIGHGLMPSRCLWSGTQAAVLRPRRPNTSDGLWRGRESLRSLVESKRCEIRELYRVTLWKRDTVAQTCADLQWVGETGPRDW